tara:strand:+ start:881 stop:2149 length:1269 start_codon:yes stop_codon:yes gene_type:complete
MSDKKICIIGLGYVGFPLAIEFSKYYNTKGFDINSDRISQLKGSIDITGEIQSKDIKKSNLFLTNSKEDILDCNIYIVTVPTPIDQTKKPDLSALQSASKFVGSVINKGDIVIYESTVFPGCTRDECIPLIEKESKMKLNDDFLCGYSPERINPGDKINTLKNITKIVSGSNKEALNLVNEIYTKIVSDAKTFPVSSMEIAEAAKVIENTQRDLNIAFVNELSLIFDKLNINTKEVIDAAATKWNFLPFQPGLVGGHCIGVDPYYLTYKADVSGYSPEIILAGRRLNDNMGFYIAEKVIKLMISKSIIVENSKILVLGLTFKENCPDIRNSKVIDVISELKEYKTNIDIYDPWADSKVVNQEYGLDLMDDSFLDKKYDAIVVAVSHKEFLSIDLEKISHQDSIVFDIKSVLPKNDKLNIYQL